MTHITLPGSPAARNPCLKFGHYIQEFSQVTTGNVNLCREVNILKQKKCKITSHVEKSGLKAKIHGKIKLIPKRNDIGWVPNAMSM